MPTSRQRVWLAAACALASLAASGLQQVDATKVDCATFQELGENRQKRVLSFLQGYGHRKVPEENVGTVAIGGGLTPVLDACAKEPYAPVSTKVNEVALGDDPGPREGMVSRPPTRITCRDYLKLNREDRRLTLYWLDGYSRKSNPRDANQSVVSLTRDPEDWAERACERRVQRLWWAVQGGIRSVDPAPKS